MIPIPPPTCLLRQQLGRHNGVSVAPETNKLSNCPTPNPQVERKAISYFLNVKNQKETSGGSFSD